MFEKAEFAAPMDKVAMKEQGVGARLVRKEDDRLLRGRGQFVADLRFRRHERRRVRAKPARSCASSRHNEFPTLIRSAVFTARRSRRRQADPRRIRLFAASSRQNNRRLAPDKVRHVGELVAMCVAPSRAQAEDIAGTVVLDLDELPAVHDMLAARAALIGACCTSNGATTYFLKPSST